MKTGDKNPVMLLSHTGCSVAHLSHPLAGEFKLLGDSPRGPNIMQSEFKLMKTLDMHQHIADEDEDEEKWRNIV